MANAYRTWAVPTEQDWVTRLDSFLVNVVGWYRSYTHTDSPTDRKYSWVSEGETLDGRTARIVSAQGISDSIILSAGYIGSYDFSGSFGATYVGQTANTRFNSMSSPGRCRSVASKDRVWVGCETSTTSRFSGYMGHIDSFYSAEDDPQPTVVRGQPNSTEDWTGTSNLYGIAMDGTEIPLSMYFATEQTDEGYPNPRNGEFSFFNPIVYHATSAPYYEVRGRLKGVYYGKQDRLGHGSFVTIGEKQFIVTKTTDEEDAMVIGPVSETGLIEQDVVQLGFPSQPYMKVESGLGRGLEYETGPTGTLSLWRFDVGQLNGYKYGSGFPLPVPSVYVDESSTNDLVPRNGLLSVSSRLNEAASLNGTTNYADSPGNATSSGVLLNEWTYECVFKPSSIPTSSGVAALTVYSSLGDSSSENTLLSVSVVAASGTTPDQYLVERGNIHLGWEKDSGVGVYVQTTGDFIQQDRWNYLAITKEENGPDYDISIWHCSFGDHRVPKLKQVFSGLNNATDGSGSGWIFGKDPAGLNFYAGEIDDTRITKRVLTQSGIAESCLRSML